MKSFKLSPVNPLLIRGQEVSGPILFSVTFFLLFAFVGFVLATVYPSILIMLIDSLVEMAEGVSELNVASLSRFIFLNNIFVALMASLGGLVFAFLPVAIVVINGFIIGVVYYLTINIKSSVFFFAGVIPHGVIELPVIIFSVAIGIWLGSALFNFLFLGDESIQSLRHKIKRVFYTYVTFILPLLFLAALVEAFVTPKILDLFISSASFNESQLIEVGFQDKSF